MGLVGCQYISSPKLLKGLRLNSVLLAYTKTCRLNLPTVILVPSKPLCFTGCSSRVLIFFTTRLNVHKTGILIIKPTRCTNFSNLFLE